MSKKGVRVFKIKNVLKTKVFGNNLGNIEFTLSDLRVVFIHLTGDGLLTAAIFGRTIFTPRRWCKCKA
jgi:hypothetical protein